MSLPTEKCSWCKKEVPEVFRFVFEEDGEETFMCGECLNEIENEFYKDGGNDMQIEEGIREHIHKLLSEYLPVSVVRTKLEDVLVEYIKREYIPKPKINRPD